MKIGVIGLGKMGLNLALNMKEHGHYVEAFDIGREQAALARKEGIDVADSLEEMAGRLHGRKVIWLMVPFGKPVDELIQKLLPFMEKRDIIIDGGNSHYKDTLRRYEELKAKDIDFVDIGTSGGTSGARNGICAMVGAEREVFDYLEPLIKDISVADGYLYAGRNGAGHYLKMIHNGIEYGMIQAIGEGFEILHKSQFDYDYERVAKVWNNGSVIRSWLMELVESAFKKDEKLESIRDIIRSSGEGLWTVQEALELKVPAPVITDSLLVRYRSEQEESFSAKVAAALRKEFGGHAVERKQQD